MIHPPDPIPITLLVTRTFEELGVPYFIGGSLASIVHGMVRTTADVDLVAEMDVAQARLLAEVLEADFWIDQASIVAAIHHQSSFALVHRDTLFKVDVFIKKERPFERSQFRRREEKALSEQTHEAAWVCSAEDIILAKLEWFKMGGEVSERQWRDILGVMKLQAGHLDEAYLHRWAASLGVESLLLRALEQGGEGAS